MSQIDTDRDGASCGTGVLEFVGNQLGMINGIPVDRWGMWCPHGHRVLVPDPRCDTNDRYPAAIVADPWPCEKCTPEDLYAAGSEDDSGITPRDENRLAPKLLDEIRTSIARDAERAEVLIIDLLDLADSSPNREAILEAAAQALAVALCVCLPVEAIRTVRAWRKESVTPSPAPNPTVTEMGCTVDAGAVAAVWAALLARMPPEHGLDPDAATAWADARVVPHADRDPLDVHKLRLRHGRRGPDLIAIADRHGAVFVVRKIIKAASLGKEP
jgi:hypothetical protein